MSRSVLGAEGMRKANLSRVLQLVHREGPCSRARLTELTGLNRSTVAALIGELAELGAVREAEAEPARRVGRPSPLVVPGDRMVAVVVNPEIDAIELGLAALGGRVLVRERIPVDHPEPSDAVAHVVETIGRWTGDALLDGRHVAGIGVAVPGLVRADDGLVRLAPHLGWRDEPFGPLLAEASGLPVAVANDASLGAVAEHLFGAARGHRDVVYLNGGASGIGGGIIVNDALVGGADGFAGEWGQNRTTAHPAWSGTLEDAVSRARLLAAGGLGADDDVAKAFAAPSPAFTDEVARQRELLASALANVANVLNPSVIVLGGFLADLFEDDREGLTAAVCERSLAASLGTLRISPAMLAADRLLIGAAEAAFAGVLADPGRLPPEAR
ncbi:MULTISPECIES: ROK family transcriptional regulator [Bacteria]|uniref:ROK family transcriptional regulator n=1 Tax=Bacteria TaxID=2 RepID=UPI003C7C75A4